MLRVYAEALAEAQKPKRAPLPEMVNTLQRARTDSGAPWIETGKTPNGPDAR